MIEFIAQHAGVIGLLFFFSFFVGVLFWVFRPGTRTEYKYCANIPLKEEADE